MTDTGTTFDHATGTGHVRGVRGLYYDALHNRALRSTAPSTTKRATRRWRLSYYEHWARELSGAAIFGDARVIAKQADALAVRALTALPPAPPPGCDLASDAAFGTPPPATVAPTPPSLAAA